MPVITLTCQIENPSSDQGLTVGSPFAIRCEGDAPDFVPGKTEIRLDPTDQYKLQLLDLQKESGKLNMKVTSYRVGDHQLKAVQLVDAEHSVVLSDLSFSVRSVLDPKEPRTEPYGPFGPLVTGMPIWFWIVVALIVSAALAGIFKKFFERSRRKKWLRAMGLGNSPQAPIAHLGKSLRLLQKRSEISAEEKSEALAELKKVFVFYLAQKYSVPSFYLSDHQILQEIRRSQAVLFDSLGAQLQSTFLEIHKVVGSKDRLSSRDWEQLILLVRRTCEDLEKFR